MQEINEYARVLPHLYQKSLILHDPSLFHPVLYFYFIDAMAHLDYTLGVLSYNFESVKNTMSREYLRWRVDEEEKEDRQYFRPFINWLKKRDLEKFDALPLMWALVYDEETPAEYRSFRLVVDPDSNLPPPPGFFYSIIDDFFDQEFLKSLYKENSLSRYFEEFLRETRG